MMVVPVAVALSVLQEDCFFRRREQPGWRRYAARGIRIVFLTESSRVEIDGLEAKRLRVLSTLILR